jgi:hypothetical protein
VITGVITSGFVVALIVLLILRGQLPHADRWWIWVAAFGTFLGLFGFIWVPILKRQRDRASARRVSASRAETGDEAAGQRGGGQEDVDTRRAGTGGAGPGGAGPEGAGPGRAGQPGSARRP